MSLRKAVTLIIPCYNEVKRLDMQKFLEFAGENLCFLFVDDGSTDGTAEFLAKKICENKFCKVIQVSKNGGKGEAIRYGISQLQSLSQTASPHSSWWDRSEWIGFWDADLATPLFEVQNLVNFSSANSNVYPEVHAVWGSRVYRLGSRIKRSTLRHYLGRGFATLIHYVLQVEAYDTQCGAKIFRKDVVEKSFQEAFLSRWIFDIEILMRLHKHTVIEYPLMVWEDVPGSKLRIGKEIFRVLKDIRSIRKKYLISKKSWQRLLK